MQVTETSAEGLKREFKVTIAASDLDTRLHTKLDEMKGQVHLKGFRPGKVPVSFLKKTYGKAVMGEIVEEVVGESSQKALAERELRAAMQPKIDLEGQIEDVVAGKSDLTYTMAVEILPEITVTDLGAISLERPVADVADADVDSALEEVATSRKSYADRDEGEAAEDGDRLSIDFVGEIEGEAFEGGSAEDQFLVLGSGSFIPGFEEQLVGAKVGEEKVVEVTFPEDYQAEHLAGKTAQFKVTVREVAQPEDVQIDDAFAESLGLESLEKLRELMTNRLKDDHSKMSRLHVKRHLLDALDKAHDFELPMGMVDVEFEQIWRQVLADLERQGKSIEDEEKSEDDMKAEYRAIAERRVRLGLVLAEIGQANKITVGQDEMNRAIAERARAFPGREQQLYQFYQKNPEALQEIRAPLFEDKVVDFILELATVEDKTVSKDDLFKDPEGEDEEAA